ncbi:MAG: ABC transporter ATP-binding protein [Deltaproteobacteria bacterium]
MSEPILKVKDLVYSYPGQKQPALRNISLEVNEASIFGILGPNGGGKSTTFKILSTLMKPQQGEVKICGVDVVRQPGQVRSFLGVVFQAPALDKKLTVEENIYHQGHLYGIRGAALIQKTEALLKRLGLWEKKDEKTENLSGGQKRRLEITKSLIHNPKILILDEPTTGLDPLARREVWNYLKFLREKEKITILVTTHLLDEAEDCDEIALIDKGQVVCCGNPSKLRNDLGGNVVNIKSPHPNELSEKICNQFNLSSRILGKDVRFRPVEMTSFLGFLLRDCSLEYDSFSVGKPTLEDLFIEKTGHRFWDEAASNDLGEGV